MVASKCNHEINTAHNKGLSQNFASNIKQILANYSLLFPMNLLEIPGVIKVNSLEIISLKTIPKVLFHLNFLFKKHNHNRIH